MKVGDLIRLPNGARLNFNLKSDIGFVVGMIPREDDYPDDFEVMADGLIHAMGFQLADNVEVISVV